MPLVLEPAQWNRDRLIEQLRELHHEHSQMAQVFSKIPPDIPNRWAAEAAVALANESAALGEAVLVSSEASAELIARTVNQLYEARNAIPYLILAAKSSPPPLPKPPSAPLEKR